MERLCAPGDPSLRLKNGFARDDTTKRKKKSTQDSKRPSQPVAQIRRTIAGVESKNLAPSGARRLLAFIALISARCRPSARRTLPLHIFEPRYKEMIGECLNNEMQFGVVRAVEEGIADIGCTAEIVTVTKQYPDGRLDLVAEGRSRFEVLNLNRERSFLRAEVLFVPDEPGTTGAAERARAVELHREILSLAGAVQDLSAAEESVLSFHLAGSLPLDLDLKQQLLAMRSESQRMQTLATYLESIMPNLRRAARAREKTGGNGHVH